MNVARLNFSHGDHKSHLETLTNVRTASKETGIMCGVMLDNKGPEIRTGLLKEGKNVFLEQDQELDILCQVDVKTFEGDKNAICVDYNDLAKVIEVGKEIKIDDALIVTTVISKDEKEGKVRVRVDNSGELGQRKGCNLPGTKVNLPTLTDRDKADLAWGAENGIDVVAASFTRTKEDVLTVRSVLRSVKGGEHIAICAKIESQDGLDNFDEILAVSDSIMVARGDLGVEIPLEKVILAQKMMIKKSNAAGKPVITATQMLESMLTNPRPTRAEVSDVANAVFDGTDCVMLSGETAKGKYPVKAVEVMAGICITAESALDPKEIVETKSVAEPAHQKARRLSLELKNLDRAEVIASAAARSARDLGAAAIIVISRSGYSARRVAKFKPKVPIVCLTPDIQTARQCLLSYGLRPFVVDIEEGHSTFKKAVPILRDNGWIVGHVEVVLVKGVDGVKGTTNSLIIATTEELERTT
jgi:pyruvate kinase